MSISTSCSLLTRQRFPQLTTATHRCSRKINSVIVHSLHSVEFVPFKSTQTTNTTAAMMKLSACTLSALALAATTTPVSVAYVLLPTSNTVPTSFSSSISSSSSSRRYSPLFASSSGGGESESAFVAIADDVDDDDDKNFDVVEKFGKGAAKVRAIYYMLQLFC